MSTKINEIRPIEYSANGKIITFIKPLIMAIVNITPDSFYDGAKYSTLNDVVYDVEEKINQGAHIIDIGAASSRPNATEISEEEEWKRLKEILPGIRKKFPDILLSVDTYRAGIAQRCADEGIDIINDIGGGEMDKNMFATIAKFNMVYILMHMQGTPQTMQNSPSYENIVRDICSQFEVRLKILKKLNVNQVILDPGFGFGKNVQQNYTLLKGLDEFIHFGFPIMVGVSRKGMISKVIGSNPVTALNGTTVVHTIALLNGASMLRVHDVSEAKQAIELVEFYKNA
jgi:dihydropteroate synthase